MKAAEDITCQELVELVTDYLEGALPPPERERFEEHLVYCAGCVYHLEHMRTTIELAGRITEQSLPPATEQALLEAFRDWKRHGTLESPA